FHRVIPGLMIMGGDPNTIAGPRSTWGIGGSGRTLASEFSSISHRRGILSMARANDPGSASSQFFICVADSPFLDNLYSVFGEVTSGMNVVDSIANAAHGANDRPTDPVTIRHITVRSSP